MSGPGNSRGRFSLPEVGSPDQGIDKGRYRGHILIRIVRLGRAERERYASLPLLLDWRQWKERMKVQSLVTVVSGMLILLWVSEGSCTENPHYGEVVCTACHIDEEDYELRSEDPTVLCNRCHGEGPLAIVHHPLRKVPDAIKVPEDWPLYEGKLTCLTCHLPSHDENIGIYLFLRGENHAGKVKFCFLCHLPESFAGRNPHEEVNRGKGCSFCHLTEPKAGVDTLNTITFCGDPDVLCLRCHGDTSPHPAGFRHNRVLEPAIAEQMSKTQNLYQGDRVICSTCHNPHIYESDSHKLRGAVLHDYSCPGCHTF